MDSNMRMTERISSNSDLAACGLRVVTVLAARDDLPLLGHLSVHSSGAVFLSASFRGDEVRDVCVWAAAFGAPVVIDLSDTGRVAAVLDLNGVETQLRAFITHQQAYEYGAALGIPVSPGGQVQIEPAALLAALDEQSGAAA